MWGTVLQPTSACSAPFLSERCASRDFAFRSVSRRRSNDEPIDNSVAQLAKACNARFSDGSE